MKKSVILATVAAMVCSTSIAFASETDQGNQTQGGNATNVVTEYKNSEAQSEQVAQKAQSEQVTQKPQEAVTSGDQAKDRQREQQEAQEEARAKMAAKSVDRKIGAVGKVKLNDKARIAKG